MKSMKNNRTPGNYELTKEFYKTFRDELKIFQMKIINRAFYSKILSISQKASWNQRPWETIKTEWVTLKTGNLFPCYMLTQKSCLKLFQKN